MFEDFTGEFADLNQDGTVDLAEYLIDISQREEILSDYDNEEEFDTDIFDEMSDETDYIDDFDF